MCTCALHGLAAPPISVLLQLPGRTELLLRMRQEKEELEALRKDPLQFDPDAEARKRLAETKAALSGQPSRPAAKAAAAPAAGGAPGQPEAAMQVGMCVCAISDTCIH